MKFFLRSAAVPVLVFAIAGCGKEPLNVENLQQPDVIRVFALGATIEQTLGTGYQQCRNTGMQNSGIYTGMSTMSVEGHSQLNNFNMGPRGGIPRVPILNDRSSPSVFGEFSGWQRQGRTLSNAVNALDRLISTEVGGTLGSVAQNLRARAWGFFVVGCNLGYAAMVYDSVALTVPGLASDNVPELSSAAVAMTTALAFMDTALAIIARPEYNMPLLDSWMSGTALSKDITTRFIRSYKARFRAAQARTPGQRAAVDWTKVLADAEAGIAADVVVNVGATTGWNKGWPGGTMHTDATWHQISMMYWGFGDVSGRYETWLSTPLNQRLNIYLNDPAVSPDLRLPQGTTRAEQRTASVRPTLYTGRPYIENRTVQDSPAETWGSSQYSHFRYRYVQQSTPAVSWPEFLKAEVDLLAAEALYRLGRYAEAAAKVDISRIGRGGLPGLVAAGVTNATARLSGANCVPRVPAGPSFTTTVCGDLLEALKWEKRLEMAFNNFHGWFFDSRGWGDLIFNTPLEYPVPNQEMDSRAKPFYNLGGGGPSSAARGTYGF